MIAAAGPFSSLPARGAVLVADIGGTSTTTGWIGSDGRVRARRTTASEGASGPEAVIAVVVAELQRARAHASRHGAEPMAVGIGAPGVIADGKVTFATDSIADWAGTDLAGEVEAAFGLPTRALNDVHAHGLGEARAGAGRGVQSILHVAVGTGIGGAFLHRGRLLLGAHGSAGHIGHTSVPEAAGVMCSCGKTGHLEGLSAGPGILRAYRLHGAAAASAKEVFAHAADGQNLAINVVHDCAFAVGRAIGDLLNVLDPDAVVISGGIAEAGDVWWDPVRRGVAASAIETVADTPIRRSRLRANAPLVGAGVHALSALS